jgi:hypothetical protein
MRRLYNTILCLLALGVLSISTANAQTSVLTEGFENATFPPAGWTNSIITYVSGSGTQTWYRVTSGGSPSASPHSGSAMASYNIFSLNSGCRAEMVTPPLTFPSGSEVSFWMYRDNGYLGYNEGLKVYYNTSSPTYAGGVLMATINRAIDMSPVESTTGWYKYTVPIPVSGSNIYIVFEGFSAYGNNMYLDDIDVYYFCNQPATVTASSVQQNSANLSWTAVAGSVYYEYLLDQTLGTPIYKGTNTTATSVNFSGLSSGTTYYMHVRNKCVSGALSAWTTTSFTTLAGPGCQGIGSLSAVPTTSTAAKLTWAATSPTQGYQYVIDDKPIDPVSGYIATTKTNVDVFGLAPLTPYYVHVRNVCSNNYSPWATTSFITPDCSKPVNIFYTGITPTTVDLIWSLMPNVQQYEYLVDKSPTGYTNVANATITTGITAHVQSLTPDTKYYAFVRSRCFSGMDSSEWKIDSFVTAIECGVPSLAITGLGTNSPTATWDAVPTAVAYEYALTNSPADPAFGAEIYTTNVTVNLPTDDKPQYLHVRTKCNSQFTYSQWAMEQLRTTSVSSVNAGEGTIHAYPNPVKNKLNLSVGTADAIYSLSDITGRVVLSGAAQGDAVIDMTTLANGTYVLKCTVNSETAIIKIVKE